MNDAAHKIIGYGVGYRFGKLSFRQSHLISLGSWTTWPRPAVRQECFFLFSNWLFSSVRPFYSNCMCLQHNGYVRVEQRQFILKLAWGNVWWEFHANPFNVCRDWLRWCSLTIFVFVNRKQKFQTKIFSSIEFKFHLQKFMDALRLNSIFMEFCIYWVHNGWPAWGMGFVQHHLSSTIEIYGLPQNTLETTECHQRQQQHNLCLKMFIQFAARVAQCKR